MHRVIRSAVGVCCYAAIALCLSGCTSFTDYIHNGFKVGPNYCTPRAEVAPQWIDVIDANQRVSSQSADLSRWWMVFQDQKLDELIHDAYAQNLTLKEAGCRILAARAQLGIARGEIFPQSQTMTGGYNRLALAGNGGPPVFTDGWKYGFNLAWELDFWGRFRRAIASAEASLDGSVEDYDQALVTLLADVASNYVQYRQQQVQIALAEANVKLQKKIWKFTKDQLDAGKVGKLDLDQVAIPLAQTEAAIPQLYINLRQAEIQLAILLGRPPCKLGLGEADIPTAPPSVAVGIPAELLTRRPDVRRAERNAAAQAEQIGIAEADYYPAISIVGNMGYSAQNFPQLFTSNAFNGAVGPQFQWNILNYGRLLNNVRFQDAQFQALVIQYRQTVLQAAGEVESGIVTFLEEQVAKEADDRVVEAAQSATNIMLDRLNVGTVDYLRLSTIEVNLVTAQNAQAVARGQIAQGLIQIYRALGGGWEIRCGEQPPRGPLPPATDRPPGKIEVPETDFPQDRAVPLPPQQPAPPKP